MRKTSSLVGLLITIALSACGSTTTPKNTSAEPTTSTTPDSSTPGSSTPTTTPVTTDDTTPATTGADSADVSALVDRDWKVDGLITIAGLQPVPDGSNAALRFTDNGDGTGTVEVHSGCNTGSAPVTYSSDHELTVGPITLTRMACSDDLNALEASLVGQLENPLSWTLDGELLTLIPTNVSDSGLQLHEVAPTTTTVAPNSVPGPSVEQMQRLLGTEWIPERFITVGPLDPIPADSGASLRFEDANTIALNTGCNQGTGKVAFASDGTFTVTDLTMTEIACEDDGLEVRILAQFEHTLQWGIDGDTLTVYPIDITDTGIILRDAAAVANEPTTTISAEDSAAADRAAILAAAAVDRLHSVSLEFDEIAIVESVGESGPDAMVVFGDDDAAITDGERAAVEAALAPVRVRWVATKSDPALQAATAAGQVDALVTFSDPTVEGDEATISSDIVCGAPAALCGQGGGVTLDRQPDGTWRVGEPFGPQWIF